MKIISLFVIAVAIFAGTGCGLVKECNLSSLKIKEINLQNDEGGYVAAAIENELFAKGAVRDKSGVLISGTVRISPAGVPLSASVRVSDQGFASVANAHSPVSKEDAADNIGRSAARDFCRCAESHPRVP